MSLTAAELAKVRQHWRRNPSFLGFPDAERDTADLAHWRDNFLIRPQWFAPAVSDRTTLIVGRKGVGKSASRIAATSAEGAGPAHLVVEASADELAARHAARLRAAAERGFGAVSDWCAVYAELIVRKAAHAMCGKVVVGDDEQAIRKWATFEGIAERDFGERVTSAIAAVVPWARSLLSERGESGDAIEERLHRVAQATSYTLFIDDFDNIQEDRSFTNLRLVRDAVEAADRVTHLNPKASVRLLMRQDLWLRLRPGWHYADKVSGLVLLNWAQDDLRKWAERRLRAAVAQALGRDSASLGHFPVGALWAVFFPEQVFLRNDKESDGLHYMVRRTMYTPRGLRQFMQLAIERAPDLPVGIRSIEDAENEFSVDQLEFLKTEFGGLCEGLDICLQSFTGRPMEMLASDLYKHLSGLIGNGQVRLGAGASDGTDATALARFLFRIGFLEIRYRDGERFEVRDAMRHPDHWKSIRKDDAVRWAVRSAFFAAMRGR